MDKSSWHWGCCWISALSLLRTTIELTFLHLKFQICWAKMLGNVFGEIWTLFHCFLTPHHLEPGLCMLLSGCWIARDIVDPTKVNFACQTWVIFPWNEIEAEIFRSFGLFEATNFKQTATNSESLNPLELHS